MMCQEKPKMHHLLARLFVKLLRYGDDSFDSATNNLILNASSECILSSKGLDGLLL